MARPGSAGVLRFDDGFLGLAGDFACGFAGDLARGLAAARRGRAFSLLQLPREGWRRCVGLGTPQALHCCCKGYWLYPP